MNLGDIYPAVLTLVMIGILIGIGLTVLGNLSTSSGITGTASGKINDTITAIGSFVTWLTIIVLVIAAAIILTLVIKSFRGGGR